MATNRKKKYAWFDSWLCSHPATPAAGNPVRKGKQTAVALTNESAEGNATGYTSVDGGPSIWLLTVDDNEGTGLVDGDPIYYHDTGTGTPTTSLNNSSTGADAFFGYARASVSANATTAINVEHEPHGFVTSVVGTIGTSQITNNAVTAAKLTTTMATGHIPLALASAREIATNDTINTAGDAGVLSKNTTPIFERVNAATDKKLRINWAASNSDEIVWDFTYPADLDDAATVVIHILAAMAGATDTPVIAVSYFEGKGDTNAGGNTAAVTGTTIAEYTVTIAASDIGAAPNAASIGLVPGAHTTDALHLYAVWASYSRK